MISWEKDFTITGRDPHTGQSESISVPRTKTNQDGKTVLVRGSQLTANNDFSKGRIEWFTDGELNASGSFSFFLTSDWSSKKPMKTIKS